MKLPRNRWKKSASGFILPEGSTAEGEDRLDEIVLRLPCYEPSGLTLELSFRMLLQHLLVVGLTGSGKSSLLNRAWSDLINYRSPSTGQRIGLLVLDSQGDHTITNIRRLAAEAGRADDVRVLSPTEGFFNPMSELTSFAALDSVSSKIISATQFSSQAARDNQDAYWTENTRAMVEAGLTYLLIHKTEVGMIAALRFISDLYLHEGWSSTTKAIVERCDRIVASSGDLSSGIQAKIELAQRTVHGWAKFDSRGRGVLQACLRITLSPFLATTALPYWDDRKGALVDPSEALAGKIVVVSTRAATEVETAKMICKLVKMDFYRAAQSRPTLGQGIVTGLMMDEFHYSVTKGSPRWSDVTNLPTLRGKGVFVIAATQGLIQLDLLIGVGPTEALLINFGNLILLRSVETGHLYALAERIFGYRPAQILPQIVEKGDLLIPTPALFYPPEAICPSGLLAHLKTHQGLLSLADGYKSQYPVWLAPLFFPEPTTPETFKVDQDLEALRRSEARLLNDGTSAAPEIIHYSSNLWKFIINAAPRHAAAFRLMTLGEFHQSIRGLGRTPDGLGNIPAAWRMAIFHLMRGLPPLVRVLKLGAHDGRLEIEFGRWSEQTSIADLFNLEARWKRSVYPSTLRPLHARDRRWLEIQYPHLYSEILETRPENQP